MPIYRFNPLPLIRHAIARRIRLSVWNILTTQDSYGGVRSATALFYTPRRFKILSAPYYGNSAGVVVAIFLRRLFSLSFITFSLLVSWFFAASASCTLRSELAMTTLL